MIRFTYRRWRIVGHKFVDEWAMVWKEIAIGFTVADFVAVLVPDSFWKTVFLAEQAPQSKFFFPVILENALLAPFVAAATFIGSMGNIPLATVLNSNGVMFAGIMGFIYADLMVPPLVEINARYYGWRLALYIAGIMYISIVFTALLLHYAFALFGVIPESARAVKSVTQSKMDYSLWMNMAAAVLVSCLAWLNRSWHHHNKGGGMDMGSDSRIKTFSAWAVLVLIAAGVIIHLVFKF